MAIISSFLAMFCGLVISVIGLRLDLLTYVGSFQFTTPCRSLQNSKCILELAYRSQNIVRNVIEGVIIILYAGEGSGV